MTATVPPLASTSNFPRLLAYNREAGLGRMATFLIWRARPGNHLFNLTDPPCPAAGPGLTASART